MTKITTFLIGITIISFIMVVFALFISEGNENYQPLGYNESDLEVYMQLEAMSNLTKKVDSKSRINSSQGGEGGTEVEDRILGGLLTRGYTSMRVTDESIDTIFIMTEKGIDKANLGVSGEALKNTIIIIIIILIVIGVFISALVKRDL